MNPVALYFGAARKATRARRQLLVALAVAVAAAGTMTSLAHAEPTDPAVPVGIQVPDGNKVSLVAHAVGVQIYACTTTASGYSWTFVAPRATLYNDNGKRIATHFAGPTWEATDGSRVVGKRAADPVTVDTNAIPWLLLSAASTSAGPDGGRLLATTYIQRINTAGGLTPPAADCNAATVGTQNEVPYTADYVFWKATGA